MRIAYLLKTYPKLSETFILNEILGLEKLGVELEIFSLRQPTNEPVHPSVAEVKAKVTYVGGGIERIHRERLPEFRNHAAVSDVRMLGTIAAIELHAQDRGYLSRVRTRLYPYFLDRGILLRPLGNVIYTVPPYVISADDLHYVYDTIGTALL